MKRQQKKMKIKNQQGVVLIMALFIVALVTAMSYAMLIRLSRDTERTSLILRDTQANLYAQGSIAWAQDVLNENWLKQKPNQLVDNLPLISPQDLMNAYHIQSVIYDMQSRFNLNSLDKEENQQVFQRLIKVVYPNMSQDEVKHLIQAIVEWIKLGSNTKEANQDYYFEQKPPYRAAHQAMASISELRLVKGMTADLYQALQPYITALPADLALNIQTMSAPLLASLSSNMNLELANAIIAMRKVAPFVNVNNFSDLDLVKNHDIKTDKLTVTSEYFLLETTVKIESQHLLIYTLLHRVTKNKKPQTDIVWQSKGIW